MQLGSHRRVCVKLLCGNIRGGITVYKNGWKMLCTCRMESDGPQSGWITTEMHFQYACVCSSYEWMLSGEQEWKSKRAWNFDWHIWTESIIDKRHLFVIVYKDNGLTGSTHESNRIRARVKQTVRSNGHQSTPHPLTTVCPPFRLPPWPGSTQLKHFSHDN